DSYLHALPTWPLLDDSPITHSSRSRSPLPRDRGTFYMVQGKRLRELRHRGFAKPVAESYRNATEQVGPHPR
ncbi:hypothetical protein ALC56_14443, partial [Trachymyrmex septentrionalis]